MMQAEKKKLPKDYVICIYTRLSIEDDDLLDNPFKKESGSITTQRALMYDYIERHEEFEQCKVIEKCDDGFSGTHFDTRPQFTEMIEMAKKGEIHCIMVKDFSRFGRDYVELGNYMEQLFPFMGIRFISVNDNYDSAELPEGTTGGIDVVFKNFIYDYYSREMSKKQKIAWRRMAEQGQYNANCAVYGYQKSKEDKHKLVIEPEEAEVVREIFDMKISGLGVAEIAKNLNDRNILCPSEKYRQSGMKRRWKTVGGKCFWEAGSIESVLRNEVYTGVLVQLKTELDSVGGKQIRRSKDEWVRVENTHEAIIDNVKYMRAASSLKQCEAKKKHNRKNIYRCGVCKRALHNDFGRSKKIYCRQKEFHTDSMCKDVSMIRKEADDAVLQAIHNQTVIYLEREKISQVVLKRSGVLSVSEKIASIVKSMELAQKGWISLYDQYADGKLERAEFLEEKKKYDTNMEQMETELTALRQVKADEEKRKTDRKVTQAMAFLEETELTEDMKAKLIDKVFVYPDRKIEIVWKFDNQLLKQGKADAS